MSEPFEAGTPASCSFKNVDLTEAILSEADMEGGDLSGAALLGAKGFDPNQAGIVFDNTMMPDGTIRS